MKITVWKSLTNAHGERLTMTWDELFEVLRMPQPKPLDAENPKLEGWSPATFKGDKRSRANVESVTALGLDHDKGALSLERLYEAYAGRRVLIHNTRRSRPELPRWRAVLELSRPISAIEHAKVWASERARLAALGIFVDEQTKDPSRFWFVPCEPSEGEFVFESLAGEPLDVDDILSRETQPALPVAAPSAPPSSTPAPLSVPPASYRPDEPEALTKIKTSTRRRRAAAYLKRAEPAVAGEGGHNTAMRVVTAVVRGFALDPSSALEILESWNARCEPPWTRSELDHKIGEAWRIGAVQWGSKLLADVESAEEAESDGALAKKRARSPAEQLWEQGLLKDDRGQAKRLVANVTLVLTHADVWQDAIAWDEFAERVVILKDCPAGPPGAWNDVSDIRTAEWIQRSKWRVEAGPELVANAVRSVADAKRVHPVRDFLNGLTWDGNARIDMWLVRYLGVEDSAYARAVGRRFLVAAVARVFRPGCQSDSMLILEGDQGLRKSSALRTLAGDDWFVDTGIDVRDKGAAQTLRRKWIVEFSELAALKGSDVERVKQFVSTRVDSYRPPYGRHVIDFPRQVALVGSTNAEHYLPDTTGARRFWPVKVTAVELDALVADREQLWAEAVAAFRTGELWYLDTDDLRTAASEQQEHRRAVDPWEDTIAEWLNNPVRHQNGVRTVDVLADCVKLEVAKRTRSDEMRVGAILLKLGWRRHRERLSSDASSRAYVYRPMSSGVRQGHGEVQNSETYSGSSPTDPTVPTYNTSSSLVNTYPASPLKEPEGTGGTEGPGEAGAFDDLLR